MQAVIWGSYFFLGPYFNSINRIADGLGVPPKDFMTPWPRQDGDWQGSIVG